MATVAKEELLKLLKQALKSVEPDATLLLYGSRARGDAQPDSDWDILVLADGTVTRARKRVLRRALYEIEWETGHVVSVIVASTEEWASPLTKATPFYQNVTSEAETV